VVQRHRLGVDVRFQRVVRVRQRRQLKSHLGTPLLLNSV
jgi:hypothetical protein